MVLGEKHGTNYLPYTIVGECIAIIFGCHMNQRH